MKNITIAGRVTKDAQVKTMQNGDKLAGFSVAVDDGWGDNKRTLFFDCTQFGKRGESVAPLLTKGKQVTVSGDLSTREYEGKTYLTIRVADVTLQGGGARDQNDGGSRQQDRGQQSSGYGAGGRPDFSDDIPFIMEWRV